MENVENNSVDVKEQVEPSSQPTTGSEPQQVQASSSNSEQHVPYSRFKEVNEQAKAYEQELQELRALKQQMEASKQQAPAVDKRAQALAKFKQIDPEFGDIMEELYNSSRSVQQLQAERQQQEQERLMNQVNSLYSDAKVEPELQADYNALMAIEFQRMGQLDNAQYAKLLPQVFKMVHDRMTGHFSKHAEAAYQAKVAKATEEAKQKLNKQPTVGKSNSIAVEKGKAPFDRKQAIKDALNSN